LLFNYYKITLKDIIYTKKYVFAIYFFISIMFSLIEYRVCRMGNLNHDTSHDINLLHY